MKRSSMVLLVAFVGILILTAVHLQASPPGNGPVAGAAPDVGAAPDAATPQAGGSCGCPKTAPVCCQNCDGSFAYCARSHAFCPECPAP